MAPTRRDVLKAAGAAGLSGLTGCTGERGSGPSETGSRGTGPVYEAADEFRSFLQSERRDSDYLPVEAAEGSFVEVEGVGEHAYEVTVGSNDFINDEFGVDGDENTDDQSLCIALDGLSSYGKRRTLKSAFTSLNFWLDTFAQKTYDYLGSVNVAYRNDGEDAIHTYAFRFVDRDTTVTFEATGQQMASWAEDPSEEGQPYLYSDDFVPAFLEGAEVFCGNR